MCGGDMFQRGAFPCDIHQVSLMQELSELHLLVLRSLAESTLCFGSAFVERMSSAGWVAMNL
jgi:hypothetical protein